jgi:hypothetical protein
VTCQRSRRHRRIDVDDVGVEVEERRRLADVC